MRFRFILTGGSLLLVITCFCQSLEIQPFFSSLHTKSVQQNKMTLQPASVSWGLEIAYSKPINEQLRVGVGLMLHLARYNVVHSVNEPNFFGTIENKPGFFFHQLTANVSYDYWNRKKSSLFFIAKAGGAITRHSEVNWRIRLTFDNTATQLSYGDNTPLSGNFIFIPTAGIGTGWRYKTKKREWSVSVVYHFAFSKLPPVTIDNFVNEYRQAETFAPRINFLTAGVGYRLWAKKQPKLKTRN